MIIVICALNIFQSQQEILSTRAINYLLNLPNHLIDYDFITYLDKVYYMGNKTKKQPKCLSKNDNENASNYETFTIDKN